MPVVAKFPKRKKDKSRARAPGERFLRRMLLLRHTTLRQLELLASDSACLLNVRLALLGSTLANALEWRAAAVSLSDAAPKQRDERAAAAVDAAAIAHEPQHEPLLLSLTLVLIFAFCSDFSFFLRESFF